MPGLAARNPDSGTLTRKRRQTGRLLCRTSLALEGTSTAPQKFPPQAHRKPSPDSRHQFECVGYLRSCWCATVSDALPGEGHQ